MGLRVSHDTHAIQVRLLTPGAHTVTPCDATAQTELAVTRARCAARLEHVLGPAAQDPLEYRRLTTAVMHTMQAPSQRAWQGTHAQAAVMASQLAMK